MTKWIYSGVVLATICLAGLLIGAIQQLAGFGAHFHPLVGEIIFWAATSAVGLLVLYGAFQYARMAPALRIPTPGSSDVELARYRDDLKARVRSHPKFRGLTIQTDAELEEALTVLATDADAVIRQTAGMVFVTTALMQNGRLDGLVVLGTQLRMVWRIARVYVQRPSLRELLSLYTNVAATAFVATSIEDLDIGQMFAPVTASALPALKAGIPGLHGISALLVKCVSNGAANAFLTLRVGEVARRYCALTTISSSDQIRTSATAAAVIHLRRIVAENGALIVKNAWDATAGVLVKGGVTKAEELAINARAVFDRLFHWSI